MFQMCYTLHTVPNVLHAKHCSKCAACYTLFQMCLGMSVITCLKDSLLPVCESSSFLSLIFQFSSFQIPAAKVTAHFFHHTRSNHHLHLSIHSTTVNKPVASNDRSDHTITPLPSQKPAESITTISVYWIV